MQVEYGKLSAKLDSFFRILENLIDFEKEIHFKAMQNEYVYEPPIMLKYLFTADIK